MGVYARGKKLWIRFRDVSGKWRDSSTGLDVGQETLAQATHDEIVARVSASERTMKHAPARGLTVRAYAAEWLVKRQERDLDWRNDESRFRKHILPEIGDMLLAEVRARHLVDLFHKLRTDKERDLGQRTVHNVYRAVSAMFRDARLADLVEQSPCVLGERQLGPIRDKDPAWRGEAVFTHDEASTLISDARIPFDRQIVYAIELLAGVRPGEAAALRFRHWDPSVRPLGKLVVARSYNTLRHLEKTTKTEAVKYVPVHPTLGAMLAEWKLGGWAEMMGRAPTPDDLIVPLPPDVSGRRVSRCGEPYRGNAYSGTKWREKDLPTLGWRPRRHYDMRATFITLAIEDGADPEVIRTRITHTPKARNAFEGYNRGLHWERTCQEISKLRSTRGAQREAIAATAGAGNVGSDPLRSAIVAASTENYANNSDRARRAKPNARGPPSGQARSAVARGARRW